MAYKSALTIDEAALKVLGLDEFDNIEQAELSRLWGSEKDITQQIKEARKIRDEMSEELMFAYSPGAPDNYSLLEVEFEVFFNVENINALNLDETKITKESLAEWFWERDKEKAKLFDCFIERKKSLPPPEKVEAVSISKSPNNKTINSYLKVISALSEALIGKPTGQPYADAENILRVLSKNKIEEPVGKKTLAEYLRKAHE